MYDFREQQFWTGQRYRQLLSNNIQDWQLTEGEWNIEQNTNYYISGAEWSSKYQEISLSKHISDDYLV